MEEKKERKKKDAAGLYRIIRTAESLLIFRSQKASCPDMVQEVRHSNLFPQPRRAECRNKKWGFSVGRRVLVVQNLVRTIP